MRCEQEQQCLPLDRIKPPAGDTQSVKDYTEYVETMLRDELTMDEVRLLLEFFHCGVEELVNKIVERRLVGRQRKAG